MPPELGYAAFRAFFFLVIGVAESMVTGYISSTYTNLIVFGLLIVVMLVRPSGLLGRVQLQKV